MFCRDGRRALQVFRNISGARHALRQQHAATQLVTARSRRGFSVATQLNREKLGLNPQNKASVSHTGPQTKIDFAALRGSNPDNRRLQTAVKEAALARDWQAAHDAFREAAEPDSSLYSVILWAADRCNQAVEGIRIYDEMIAKGVLMIGVHFVPLIRLAGRSRNSERVNELRQDMLKRNIDVDAFVCAALVEAHKMVGDIEGALNTWEAVKGSVVMTPPLLSSLMSATARSGNIAATEKLLHEAQGLFNLNRIHFNCVLDACKHAADADEALRFWAEFPKHDIKPDVISFTLLLVVLRRAGRKNHIDGVLQQMTTYGVLADKYFLEEHLSCILPIQITEVRNGDPAVIEALRTSASSGDALVLIKDAMANGMEISKLTRDLYRELEQLQSAATFSQGGGADVGVQTSAEQWVRIITAQPAAGAPAEYFWERLSGRTQWEAPASPILETISN